MTGPTIPQTRTVMEAGFTPREGIDEQFWRANDTATPTAAWQHCPGSESDLARCCRRPAGPGGRPDGPGRPGRRRHRPAGLPGQGPRLAELPLTLILTAEYATLRHEMNALADDLRAKGVPVTRHQFAGVDHGFTHARPAEVAWAAITMIGDLLRKAKDGPGQDRK